MSITAVLNIARNALSATQMSLQTTSHNIANVNTEGYSRQEAVLEPATPVATSGGLIGNGVVVRTVMRYYDKHLEAVITEKNNALQEQDVYKTVYKRIEEVVNEDNAHLASNITDFFASWHELSTDPTSTAARQGIASTGENLTKIVNDMYGQLKTIQSELDDNVVTEVDDINRITSSIASLNKIIFGGSVGGEQANDYLDERTNLIKELSGKLGIVSFEDEYNRTTILTNSGKALVDGGISWELVATDDTTTGYARVGWQDSSGQVYDITDQLASGSLKATVDVRDNEIEDFVGELNSIAKTLIDNVNYFHRLGNDGANVDFFDPVTSDYAKNFGLSDEVTASISNIMSTSSTLNRTDNDVALRIASLIEDNPMGRTDIISKQFSSQSAALGISGDLLINGVKVTIDAADSLQGIAGRINASAVQDVTGVTAAISENGGVYKLSLTTDPPNSISLVNGGLDVTSDGVTQLLGLNGASLTDYTSSLVSTVGEMSKGAEDLFTYNTEVMGLLNKQRESVSGVSLDEEMANLIKFQHAYQAAARLFSVADEMLQSLLRSIGA